jgi:DNA repair protein RadC
MTRDVVEFVRLNLEILRTETLPTGGTSLNALVQKLGLHTQTQEVTWVITYGSNGHLYRVVEVARGFHDRVQVDISAVMTAVLATSAPRFSLGHNHPTRSAQPSTSDNDLTRKIMDAANNCGLVFEDHIIVEPGGGFYSYHDAGVITDVKQGSARKKAASRRTR